MRRVRDRDAFSEHGRVEGEEKACDSLRPWTPSLDAERTDAGWVDVRNRFRGCGVEGNMEGSWRGGHMSSKDKTWLLM